MAPINPEELVRWKAKAKGVLKQRARVIQLLNAAERVGIAPMPGRRLHAFAYLADVLSPVWNLQAFDGKILKIEGGPHYPDLQEELDRLAVLGVVLVSRLQYDSLSQSGPRINAWYAINFQSPHLEALLAALGAREAEQAIDPEDSSLDGFLVDLAGALGTLQEDQVDTAASLDATYSDTRIDYTNVVDFGSWSTDIQTDNLSLRVTERFRRFMPERAQLSAGERLYLYASFLGRRAIGS